MQQNTTGVITLPCTQAANVEAYLRMKIDATYGLALAGASDNEIGVLANTFVASGLGSAKFASLCVNSFPGPIKYTASGIITKFASVYAGASGKVASSGTIFLGYALDDASADGSVIRVVRDWTKSTTAAASSTGTTSTTFAVGSGNTGPTLSVSVATSTGAYTATLQVPTLGAAATITLPAATGTLATLGGTETLTAKTLTAPTINLGKAAVNNTPVAATGSDLAGAAAIGAQDVVTISSDSAAKGVKLLTGVAGQRITIINTSTTACKLWPASGGTIDGLAPGAAVVIGASKRYILVCTAADTWFSIEAAAATPA